MWQRAYFLLFFYISANYFFVSVRMGRLTPERKITNKPHRNISYDQRYEYNRPDRLSSFISVRLIPEHEQFHENFSSLKIRCFGERWKINKSLTMSHFNERLQSEFSY